VWRVEERVIAPRMEGSKTDCTTCGGAMGVNVARTGVIERFWAGPRYGGVDCVPPRVKVQKLARVPLLLVEK